MTQSAPTPHIRGDVLEGPLEQFRPNTWNANKLTEHQQRALEFDLLNVGWLKSQALLIWGTDEKGTKKNIIIDGEHRWIGGRNVGFKSCPYVSLDGIPEDEAKELSIRIHKRGQWDPIMLAGVIEQVKKRIDPTMAPLVLGFTPLQLSDMSKQIAKTPPKPSPTTPATATAGEDDDTIPEGPKEAITKKGDLWRIGDHLLLCGDSFQVENRDRLFAAAGIKWVDLVVTDPPFAIYGSSSGISSDVADDKMIEPFFTQMWRTFLLYAREFAHFYVHCDWRSLATIWNTAKAETIVPKNVLVWDKGGSGLGSNYANTHELIYFGARLPALTTMRSTSRRGMRTVHAPNVLHFNRPHGEDRLHNAAKPVALLKVFLENSLEKDETVIDFFGGSGSVMLAAQQVGHKNITIEKEPRGCDVIIARMKKRAGLDAARVSAQKKK
jgi:DNA modification methylase